MEEKMKLELALMVQDEKGQAERWCKLFTIQKFQNIRLMSSFQNLLSSTFASKQHEKMHSSQFQHYLDN